MKQYKYDTHVHTSEVSGCGRITARDMVGMYRKAGYTGVVVTDHYSNYTFDRFDARNWNELMDHYLKGYYIALEEGAKQGLQVIWGIEITFTESPNDYLVFGIEESFLRENKELHKLGLESFRKLTVGSGIIVIQAHPFRPYLTQASPRLLDGVEVYNGNPRHNSRNELAMEFAEKNGLCKLSGSDFHQEQDLARGGIIVSEVISTPAQLVDVIVNDRILGLIKTP